MRARDQGRIVLANYGGPRPDVAGAYAGEPSAGLSGFSIDAAGPGGPGLRLEWLDGAGEWHEFWREPGEQTERLPDHSDRPVLPAALTRS